MDCSGHAAGTEVEEKYLIGSRPCAEIRRKPIEYRMPKRENRSEISAKKAVAPRCGRFITLEGPEGCGKTTQVKLLVARLQSYGEKVVAAREPGGTATGEAIRNILQHDSAGEPIGPEAETLLFEASRAQLCRQVIQPALESGAWVICDRFADSTTAYQGYGRGLSVEGLLNLNRFAIGETVPDLTILLDIDISCGFQRVAARLAIHNGQTLDRMEREDRVFHEKVRAGYLDLARKQPDRFLVVDAARNPVTVFNDIWEGLRHAGLTPD